MAIDLQKAQEKLPQTEEGSGDQKEASKMLLDLKVGFSMFGAPSWVSRNVKKAWDLGAP